MASRSKVAVLRTQPETVIEDYSRLFELAGGPQALDPRATTILKDNISWHYPMPGANAIPWQLEGIVRALRGTGFADLVCVQNKTVVTNAFKGEDLNGYLPICRHYGIPVLYNFRNEDIWRTRMPLPRHMPGETPHCHGEPGEHPMYVLGGSSVKYLPHKSYAVDSPLSSVFASRHRLCYHPKPEIALTG
jgi:hypothetical protein